MKSLITVFFIGSILGVAACGGRSMRPEPGAAAAKRLPLRAVVSVFQDATSEARFSREGSPTGPPVFQDNLTRGGSAWRPQLAMDYLSGAMAEALKARVTQEAQVIQSPSDIDPVSNGAMEGRLFVKAVVREAAWTRSTSGGGAYRLTAEFAATLEPKHGRAWTGWTKTVEVEQPHRGRPEEDLAKLADKAAGEAAEDLGRSLGKVLAVQAAADAEGQRP